MVNFMLIDYAVRDKLLQTVSDEQLAFAITNAIHTALVEYDREKEKKKKQKHM